jgi:hypothetical protein
VEHQSLLLSGLQKSGVLPACTRQMQMIENWESDADSESGNAAGHINDKTA